MLAEFHKGETDILVLEDMAMLDLDGSSRTKSTDLGLSERQQVGLDPEHDLQALSDFLNF